jgi:hypothetical protein
LHSPDFQVGGDGELLLNPCPCLSRLFDFPAIYELFFMDNSNFFCLLFGGGRAQRYALFGDGRMDLSDRLLQLWQSS